MNLDGEHDWMDPAGGLASIENLKKAGNENGRMYVIPDAGHHGACFAFVVRNETHYIFSLFGQCESSKQTIEQGA
jgi:hypothetical protein